MRSVSVILIHTLTENKLTALIKAKLAPLERSLTQLRTDINTLRDTVNEQNKVLATLTDRSEKQINDFKILGENVDMLEGCRKDHKHRIETIEIGHVNLTKAVRNIGKSVSDLSNTNNARHTESAPSETSRNTRDARRTVTSSGDSLNNTRGVKRTASSPVESLMPKRSFHSAAPPSLVSQGSATPSSSGITQPKGRSRSPEATPLPIVPVIQENPAGSTQPQHEATWADIAADEADNQFTLVSRNNASNHRETTLPSSIANGSGDRNGSEGNNGVTGSASVGHRSSIRETYRMHTALVIHDDYYNDFDKRQFNKQFNVHLFKANSFSELERKSKKFNALAKRLRPDCIYIHTGVNDFLKRKSGLNSYVKDLAEHLLESTKAQICFSLLIPSSSSPELNDRIKLVNKDI